MTHSRRVFAALLMVCLMLSGCASGGVPDASQTPDATLPPATVGYVAPIGDASLEYTADATLYLPRHDGTRLVAVNTQVAFSLARPHAESLVRALLSYPGDGVASQVGGSVRLTLYGVNPVEVSRNVATVNLGATALQLDRASLYLACQAIANTLTELSGIHYVNVLVVDKPVGLDIGNSLPMGLLGRYNGNDVNAVYEQLLSRRVSTGENPKEKALSANVALYFPLPGQSGVMSEARAVSFGSQALEDMVIALLRELAEGPQEDIVSPALPLLADLLASQPVLDNTGTAGGDVLSLDFTYNLDEMLEAHGLNRAEGMASLCYTLCSFFPNLAGIRVSIGGEEITSVGSGSNEWTFSDGVLTRADFAHMLMDECVLYYADAATGRLTQTRQAAPYSQKTSPRALLPLLAQGPQEENLAAVMPEGCLQSTDILGLALTEGTLLVNLSPAFLNIDLSAYDERLFAYAIVNTLCADEKVASVCFFVSGSQFDGFGGDIYWRGLFYPMHL